MSRLAAGLIAVLLAAGACTTATTGSVGAAQECARSGGNWRASVGTCERSTGGGGY